ncbi:MAG TPA: SulP family inorganic anion transporter [Acidimicrobiia bacterium]
MAAAIPGLDLITNYKRAWFRPDLIAAIVLTTLLVPQGMAYAELAGLPAVTGLYATVASLVGYAAFGPSRILVIGPDSSLAPLIAAAVLPLAAGDQEVAVTMAAALAVFTGAACILAGVVRAGTIAELLSRPVRVGLINGIALLVLVSQLPKLFGFSIPPMGFVDGIVAFRDGLADGQTVPGSLLLGVGSILVIVACQRWWPKVPGVLVAVVAATAVCQLLGLDESGVALVGPLPSGVPVPSWPALSWDQYLALGGGALAVALVTFADTSALSSVFSVRRGEVVDPNKEAIGLGVANVAAGLLSGFPTSASSSRTAVADSVGARSQMAGLMAAAGVLLVMLVGGGLLALLPSSVLAAVVIAATMSLFDVATMRWLWNARRSDFVLALITFLAVPLLGVLEGLVVAIVLSLGNFVRLAWRPHVAVLGRVNGRKGYHDLERHPEGVQVPGLLIFRFDAPLFFANARYFVGEVERAIAAAPTKVRWLMIAAEPITDVDTTGAEVLESLLDDLEGRQIILGIAELKGPAKDRLKDYGLFDRIGEDRFFSTLGTAVHAYVEDAGVEWTDWTEDADADHDDEVRDSQ